MPRSAVSRSDRLSRRHAVRLSAGAALALGLWPGALRAAARAGGRFRFIVANDLHALSTECGGWLESVVRRMKADRPDFVLLAGDLTELADPEYFALVRDAFSTLGAPYYAQIGNHDHRPNSADRSRYEEFFPGRINYTFDHSGWQFVALDSTEGVKYESTRIQPATFAWLEANLKRLDPAKPTVILTHFPLGANTPMRPENADDLLERFDKFNLRAAFSGHFHGYTERDWKDATLLTNKCCALKRGNHDRTHGKGYFLCTADGVEIRREFRECPVPAGAGNLTDPK